MRKAIHWLDANLEEFLLVILLVAMTFIMGIQVFCRYALGMSLSWSEELTRCIFIWCGFLAVSPSRSSSLWRCSPAGRRPSSRWSTTPLS